ncbi:hypothetical protein DICPUDRAFT_57308 [Dictyostelium purpureum]|uniref:N-acetyltransferase domain-containing protein n=1 Tax=Dictyostelium purpureum TaxID=5786 RepID=F0ZVG3_DICPU|nr:uncharacterized protein DICPUDRAFT_57308 [Dictyostelium purpureum]EGC32053.1 hypothetical protein DICPUDRAFT_57308 [Dictyostelium purpureum]|eukprot:XP_003291407.1 hypothetical protein DICPUDRAFT_57308 [Dictyostelium purpureum]
MKKTLSSRSQLNTENNNLSVNNNNSKTINNNPKSINSTSSPSNNPLSQNHNPNQGFPHFSELKAGHILTKNYLNNHQDNNSNINSLNSTKESNNNSVGSDNNQTNNKTKKSPILTPSNSYQRIIDPDEEAINFYSFSGFFHKSLIFFISFLPLLFVEKLLTLFAWVQLELLKAKGRNIGGSQQSYSKLKKKRKSQKKKKNKSSSSPNLTGSANSTDQLEVPNSPPSPQAIGTIPVAHTKSSPLVLKHQRRFSLSSSTPGISSILKNHRQLNNTNSALSPNHSIKEKLLHQQLQNQLHQKSAEVAAIRDKDEDIIKSFPSTLIPDQIPVTATPTIKLTTVDDNDIINQHNDQSQQHHHLFGSPDAISSTLERINLKHRNSISAFDQLDNNNNGSDDNLSLKSDASTGSRVTFSDEKNMLDWNNNLNPNDFKLGHYQMSQENINLFNSNSLNQHNSLLQQQQQQLQQMRHRSDSISVLPSLIPKPISEIRRVNSEQTLFQSSEDTLRFEANLQSKKEFEDFLRSVKDIKDVHNWLKNFSGSASKKIAIVKISRRILDTQYGIDSAASSLCFMYKFGLYPIVIHGGMNDISKLPISEVVRERRMRSALLKEAIKKNGVGCTVLTPDICEIEPYVQPNSNNSSENNSDLSEEEQEYGQSDVLPSGGLNMKIDSFDYDILTQALDKGKIPIWDSVAESIDGVDIPINSDVTTFELAKRIQPYKIVFACNDGGILDADHKAIPVVYMDQDYKTLVEADHTTNRRRVQLKQMKRIVSHLSSSTTVVVTSIENITHQLLFPRLANGTIIKKSEDNKVLIYDSSSYHNIDMPKLRELIEDSFGKKLSLDYFDYLKDSLYKLYLCISSDGGYNGCAIVTFKEPDYIPYLCKFCVRKSAQGLGLGDLIWRVLQRDNEKLYWRSRNSNPLNPWYFQRCQGSFRPDLNFTIFWYGDDKFEDGKFLIDEALNKPVTIR